MSVMIMIAKVIVSFFMAGLLIGGFVKLSPAHRNPAIRPVIEISVGIFGLGMGLLGLYVTWFVWV
jgi:cytochrome c biogenesis protein CcdA